jgi:hypothetical protein
MARTVLTVQNVVRTGLTPVYSAGDAANGHSFDNTGENVFLIVINGDAADKTVTVTTPGTVDGQTIGDLAVVVTASEERVIGPFPNAIYGTVDTDPDPDIDPAVFVDLSADTSVTLGAFKMPDASY